MSRAPKEVLVMIDELTIKRHQTLYNEGDYARIADASKFSTGTIIRSLKKTKVASLSLAKAMKTFYQEKEQMVQELNS